MEEAAEKEKRTKTNRQQCCCCFHEHRLGNMHVLLESRDGTPILMVGPGLGFCLSVTSPLILGLSALVCYFVIYKGKVVRNLPGYMILVKFFFLPNSLFKLVYPLFASLPF